MAEENVRHQLIEAIARTYSLEQLDAVVLRALGERLEIRATGNSGRTVIRTLLDGLELQPNRCAAFFLNMYEWTTSPQMRSAIRAYLGMKDDTEETYDELIVLEEPFVNRKGFRNGLRQLFHVKEGSKHALVARGDRAIGKSHSRWLIKHASTKEGFRLVEVNLLETADVMELVFSLYNEMDLPTGDLNDRLAQFTTIAKGFLTRFRGHVRNLPKEQRWCLLFDGHDSERLSQDVRDLVDLLLADVANMQLPSIWMIVLGHRPGTAIAARGGVPEIRVIADDIEPITRPHVEEFLRTLASRYGRPHDEERRKIAARLLDVRVELIDCDADKFFVRGSPGRVKTQRDVEANFIGDLLTEVFQGLEPPMDRDGMGTMRLRVLGMRDRLRAGRAAVVDGV